MENTQFLLNLPQTMMDEVRRSSQQMSISSSAFIRIAIHKAIQQQLNDRETIKTKPRQPVQPGFKPPPEHAPEEYFDTTTAIGLEVLSEMLGEKGR